MTMDAALIVSIVRKGWGSRVLEASVQAGARGGTVLFGRGAGIHEHEKIFGMAIEPEKEIVLTIVRQEQVDRILDAIVRAAELNDTGRGIAFVLPVEKVVGVAHFMRAPDEG
jgi:nitrogen regulatory protein PII